ncbi:MAG: PBP1A family penicillin-binding protein [Treponema sp.]|nr:PBP1A family penicillin-binding protein [Treponema sp.]
MGQNNGNGFFLSLVVKLIAAFTIIVVIIIGIGLGLSIAMTSNIMNEENFVEFAPALPSKLLDINGILITEFASDEKREMVSLNDVPQHLIHAILAREDPDFYNHRGFSIRAIARATWGQIINKRSGGGSTITQQVAGTLYTDRTERTIKRKLKELWWALQMERRYTKNEILEIYINYMPMGPGAYGVETASKYFFFKSASDVTLAESTILAILLSAPSLFDPIKNPNLVRDRQQPLMDRMIQLGYTTREEADASFNEYWDNFDYTRPALSVYLTREDKAPWFSEYVRRELDRQLYGTRDYFRDGYIVHTTLNLAHQEAAERYMARGLEIGNREYAALNRRSNNVAIRGSLPLIDLLTLTFDLGEIRAASSGQHQTRTISRYSRTVNPVIDLMVLAFGIDEAKTITDPGFAWIRENTEQNVVEGALITIENDTGYITAIVGGSKFDESNQLIRATQASVQPGSAFKPLYYSAAIDSRKFTMASMIYDSPMVFYNEDGTPYFPQNYGGAWRGPVLLYNVLSLSLNIPSLHILEQIGFDAAINRSAALLDFTEPAQIRRNFPRLYPLGLGISSVSPLQMARAFAVFANQGRVVTPIAIREIQDRNGRVIYDNEREVRQAQRRLANNGQIVTPQNAFVMTRLLEFGVTAGTLALGTGAGSKFTYRDAEGRTYRMPVGGKTGTTQNWADAWVVGYTPYYTTAIWFGFDRPGNSLGTHQTGAQLGGPVWGDYMSEIHRGLPQRNFVRPTGVVDAVVCRVSGLLPTEACVDGRIYLTFLAGTIPASYCVDHGRVDQFDAGRRIQGDPTININIRDLDDIGRITLDPTLFSDPAPNNRTPSGGRNTTSNPIDIPDTPVPFTPGNDDDDGYLPSWNPLN